MCKIIRDTVSNLNTHHLNKSLTVMSFWLLEPFLQEMISLQAEVVVVVAEEEVVEGEAEAPPPMQVAGPVPTQAMVVVAVVLVEGDLTHHPL